MWFLYAMLASVFWGATYVLNEQAYKHISFLTSLAISFLIGAITFGVLSVVSGTLARDMPNLTSPTPGLLFALAGAVGLVVAEIFIGLSITHKSATLAGLIEISYPIFIALFAFLFFKESQSLGTALGGALIFLGVGVIYFFNR